MSSTKCFITTHIKNVETDQDVESVIRLDAIISLTKSQAHRCEILLNTGQAVDSADCFEDVLEKIKQLHRLMEGPGPEDHRQTA